jgi:hypothetical protein
MLVMLVVLVGALPEGRRCGSSWTVPEVGASRCTWRASK